MQTDNELLRHFVATGEESSFAEVVRRHADLVYSAALRLTNGDAALAQDVSQQVFIDLARKAEALAHHATLVGWLHLTTRYNANRAIRGEQRRRTREQETMLMQNETAGNEPQWAQISPWLDEAVGQLNSKEGEAVLLRFFKDKSYREVGDVLGLSEDSARKKVDRAVEKLRDYFARRGVKATSTLLSASIVANSVQAAPVGLANSWSGAAVALLSDSSLAISPKQPRQSSSFTKFVLISMGILVMGSLVAISPHGLIYSSLGQTGRHPAAKGITASPPIAVERPKVSPVPAKSLAGQSQDPLFAQPTRASPANVGEFEERAFPVDSEFLTSLPGYSIGEPAAATANRLKALFIHLGVKFPDGQEPAFLNGKLYAIALPNELDTLDRLIRSTRVKSPAPAPLDTPENLPPKVTAPYRALTADGHEISILGPEDLPPGGILLEDGAEMTASPPSPAP